MSVKSRQSGMVNGAAAAWQPMPQKQVAQLLKKQSSCRFVGLRCLASSSLL